MSVSITGMRFVVVVLALFGYSIFFTKRWKINRFAAPLFSISMITLITYFCGLLRILKYSSYIICAVGLLLLVVELCLLNFRSLRNIETINSLNFLILICFIILIVSLIDMHLIHYDNFSHWAVVVKEMLVKDAFPTATSTLIDFKNYPLGTSSWIYYVCRIAGSTEGVMLAAQGTMIYASILAMFCVIRDYKRLLLSAILVVNAGIMSVFNVSIGMDNLLVDYVLPLVSLGVIALIYYYRENMNRCILAITPILSMMLIIKNNAAFFLFLCGVYLFYTALHTTHKFRNFMKACLCLSICMGVFFSWSYHKNSEFKDANLKFDLSQDATESRTLKTNSEIEIIITEFKSQVFTRKNLFSVGFVSINVVALLAYILGVKHTRRKWNLLKVLLCMDAIYIFYYGGILLMYIFLMPMEEACYLAGFERYTSSIMFFLLGVLAMTAVVDVENSFHVQQGRERNIYAYKSLKTKKIYLYMTVILSSIGGMLLVSDINAMKYANKQYRNTLPGKVEAVVGNRYAADNCSSYAIYATDTDTQVSNYYLGYIARYMLFTDNLYVFSDFNEDYIVKNLKDYDYLVLVEVDDEAKRFLGEEPDAEVEPGIYKTNELSARLGVSNNG